MNVSTATRPLSALIPLDGTRDAEEALATLPFLGQIGVTQVRLVCVNPETNGAPALRRAPAIRQDPGARSLMAAYLNARAESMAATDLNCVVLMRQGDPAEQILAEASECTPSLIVIATRGRTGEPRFRLGGVVDKVARMAPCPTLVIGPNVKVRLAGYHVRHIVVPVDGSAPAETACHLAELVAHSTGAALELVCVPYVSPLWLTDPCTEVALDEFQGDVVGSARTCVDSVIPEASVQRTTLPLTFGSKVGASLLQFIETHGVDLVVMWSHGRHGLRRRWLGSIAEDLVAGPAPVLILHGQGAMLEAREGL